MAGFNPFNKGPFNKGRNRKDRERTTPREFGEAWPDRKPAGYWVGTDPGWRITSDSEASDAAWDGSNTVPANPSKTSAVIVVLGTLFAFAALSTASAYEAQRKPDRPVAVPGKPPSFK